MGVGVWELLRPAMIKGRQNCESLLRFKNGKVSDYLEIDLNSLPLRYLSALVFIGAYYYSSRQIEGNGLANWLRGNPVNPDLADSTTNHQEKFWIQQIIGMGTILQLMYLAAEVHNQIKDNEGSSALNSAFKEETPHFPVLFGDFIFGKLLKLLGEIDCIDRVSSLADIICQINKGAILRKEILETGRGDREITVVILNKEFGHLFFEAGQIGVLLAGGSHVEANHLGRFGKHLGIIIGAIERHFDDSIIELGRREAIRSLAFLPEGWLREAAQQLVREITIGINPERLAVASGE
ncbi:MAG: hypothetical protein GX755_07575 [Syntrophomonadaceae bacterium]|nr:hypothetical protein [Syntrophomonadaceae bacterium]